MTKNILIIYAFFISLGIGTLSCHGIKDYPIDTALFMGTYRVKDLTIPYPFILQKSDRKYYLLDHNGTKIDSSDTSEKLKVGDTLVMQNHIYEAIYQDSTKLNLFQLNDTIHFPYYQAQKVLKYRATFVPTIITNRMSAIDIKNQLFNKTFILDEVVCDNPNEHLKVLKYLIFGNDSLTSKLEYYYENELLYSEYQVSAFSFFNIGDKTFLTTNEDKGNPLPLMQVLTSNGKQLVLRYFIDDNERIDNFKITNHTTLSSSTHYENCFDGHIGEYYHNQIDVTYRFGNEYLIKNISKNAPFETGDGYIIVHFNINCHNQLGRPGLIMMDKNYKSKKFSNEMVRHVLQKVMKLKEWPSSVSDNNSPLYPYLDVHNFLMFKIENGKITDLCP